MNEVRFITVDHTTPIHWTSINVGTEQIKVNITMGGLNTYAKAYRYPKPRKRKSEARMSKEWRGRA